MTEHDKIIKLVSYIEGIINGNEYYTTFDIKAFRAFCDKNDIDIGK